MAALWFLCDVVIAILIVPAVTALSGSPVMGLLPLGLVLWTEAPRGRRRKSFPPYVGFLTRGCMRLVDWIWHNVTTKFRTSPLRWDDATVDAMSGDEFGAFVAQVFRFQGWQVTLTQGSGDQGADVIAQKGSTRLCIQAKRYSTPVGNGAVQEAIAGKIYWDCNRALVVTSNTFTRSARELANKAHVELWDREALRRAVMSLRPEPTETPKEAPIADR